MDNHFIDLPVYRLSSERYYKERDKFVNNKISRLPHVNNETLKSIRIKNPGREMYYREYLNNLYGGAWNYNEIIGFIELYFLGSQIRGEYWQMKAKRIRRTRRKEFEFITWRLSSELEIPKSASNSEIFNIIREYLENCSKELKGRYIDTRRLETIGSFVSWKDLLNHINDNLNKEL